MPVTYSIDAGARIIRTTCSGAATLEEVIAHFRTLSEDPLCTGDLDVLLNVSDMELFPEGRQLAPVVTELAKIREKVRFGLCAIVATQDTMFGMMRMFEVFAGKHFRAIRVFRNLAEAEAWLVSHQL